ncbi:hypothetical protein M8C13_05650 [Crossiella sp. SN42]|uniref:hypothetical protein n=1 Tax=Crossiella sp. SN42 TaxID=2944808 RepID=UPI00207C5F16|nr:hypothetical protein [Crossiella sp. SN42]MCO1575242.1 hypothetical protein [Crossiella sp. SN42]
MKHRLCKSQREARRAERTVYRVTPEGKEEFSGTLGELLTSESIDCSATMTAASLLVHLPSPQVAEQTHRVCVLEFRHLRAVERTELTSLDRGELDWDPLAVREDPEVLRHSPPRHPPVVPTARSRQ